jgi:hypothetical protein
MITDLPTEWRVRALNTVANLLELKVMFQSSYLPVKMFLVAYIDLFLCRLKVCGVLGYGSSCEDVMLCSFVHHTSVSGEPAAPMFRVKE